MFNQKLPLLAASALLLAACAGSPPKPTNQGAQVVHQPVNAGDHVSVFVDAAADVKVLDYEQMRLVDQLKIAIDSGRAQNIATGAARELAVKVTVTRYQKGNAVARAMLAGLGQIHLSGHVRLIDSTTHDTLSEFDMAKTFAWGGVYGATRSIEDIERTFAQGVADTLADTASKKKVATMPKS